MKDCKFSTYSSVTTYVKINSVKTIKIHNVAKDVRLPNNTEHLILWWDHFIYTLREDYIDIRGENLRSLTFILPSIEGKDVKYWILSELRCNMVAPRLEYIKFDTCGKTNISQTSCKMMLDILKKVLGIYEQ